MYWQFTHNDIAHPQVKYDKQNTRDSFEKNVFSYLPPLTELTTASNLLAQDNPKDSK